MKWFDKILYFILFPVVVIGNVITPTTSDVKIFQGVEYLASVHGIFPWNISYYWEIKPIFNRVINYALLKFSSVFVPFSNHFAQDIILKTVAVCFGILVSYLFARHVLKIRYSFLLTFFALFCTINMCILQAEWWAVCFALLSCSLLCTDRIHLHYLAGAILTLVLFTKGTTACLIIPSICIVYLFTKEQNPFSWLSRATLGFVFTSILFAIAAFTIWPEMLGDIMLAPMMSHVGEFPLTWQLLGVLISTGIAMSVYLPVVGLGVVLGGILVARGRVPAIPLLITWLIPFLIIWFQGEVFAYHYFVLVPRYHSEYRSL